MWGIYPMAGPKQESPAQRRGLGFAAPGPIEHENNGALTTNGGNA